MKTHLSFLAIFLFACSTLLGQIPSLSSIKTEPMTVNTGISFTLHSKTLNEDRTVMIGVPEGYEKSTRKYPVFYLLDGQWSFNFTQQTIGWLSNPQFGFIPPMIVVALHTGGETRTRDLTPTQDRNSKQGGGADKLYKFILEEVIPFVDKNYRTYNYKVLCGTSFGGVFVMNAFNNNPQFFNGYISLSPSMWWDNKILLDRTKDLLIKNPDMRSKLFTNVANEGIGMGVDSLASILEKYAPKNLLWKFEKDTDEVHETTSYKGIWDGIKFIMADWSYPLVEFGTKEKKVSANDSATYGKITHKTGKVSEGILKSRSGLYIDNYGRTIVLTKLEKNLEFSCKNMPGFILYPESSSKFFLNKTDIQEKLFLKGFDILFEFPKEDSLVITANGKSDCTAKKIKTPPIVSVPISGLNKFAGTYSPAPQGGVLQIIAEGGFLKATAGNSLYLYPTAENKFFAFTDGRVFEIEFENDGKQTSKLKIFSDGKLFLESKRIK